MNQYTRRNFLKAGTIASAGSVFAGNALLSCTTGNSGSQKGSIKIDPTPQFDIAPTLFMQFLEPLGTTEPAIEAAWDYGKDDWREDVIRCVADLNPGMIRWGGNFTRYYKWREGIGPADKRPLMYNYYWGGRETNRVGTHEFIDLCKRTGAAPLLGVNFMSDGFEYFKNTSHGQNRFGTLEEAAEWVSYCNDPDNRERIKNGSRNPFSVKYWQVGNETSYGGKDGFSLDQTIVHTREFAEAMRHRDPSIKLIGWGDVPNNGKFKKGQNLDGNDPWASKMVNENGDLLDMIAIHMMGMYPEDSKAISGYEFFKHPEEAWNELLKLAETAEFRLSTMDRILKSIGSDIKIAVTEGHLSLSPYNTNQILMNWLSAAYHARTMNIYLRHADRVSVCTGADFFGTRWTVNGVRLPVPYGDAYLLPIGTIMKLYKKYGGNQGINITEIPDGLDIAGTRRDDKIFLHVLNKKFSEPVNISLQVNGFPISSAKAYEIAPEDRLAYVDDAHRDTFEPKERQIPDPSNHIVLPASVSVIEIQLKA